MNTSHDIPRSHDVSPLIPINLPWIPIDFPM